MDRDERDRKGRRVGQHVHGVGYQRQAAGQDAADDFGQHEAAGQAKRGPEP
ncbi:hypothetical protein D3C71_1902620 [compost metagenome]